MSEVQRTHADMVEHWRARCAEKDEEIARLREAIKGIEKHFIFIDETLEYSNSKLKAIAKSLEDAARGKA